MKLINRDVAQPAGYKFNLLAFRDLKKQKKLIFIFLLLIMLSLSTFTIAQPAITNQFDNTEKTFNIDYNKEYDLKIVLFGFTETQIDTTTLEQYLINWHVPLPFWRFYGTGVQLHELTKYNYSINYEYEFINDQRYIDYVEFLKNTGEINPGPTFTTTNVTNASVDTTYIPTETIEEYLISNGISESLVPTLVIMDLYSMNPDQFFPHFYSLSTKDWDTIGQYKIADGGRISNTLWLDLSAGPTEYLTGTEGEITNETVPPIWNYAPQSEKLHRDLGKYIQTAIELKFLQSTPFTPVATFDEIHLDFKVYSITEDKTDLAFQTDEYFEGIVDELRKYNPHASWTYNYGEFEFSEEQQTEFDEEFEATFDSATGQYDYTKLQPFLVKNYKEHFNIDDTNTKKKVIPIYSFHTGNINIGANGIANNDKFGEFTYIIHRSYTAGQIWFLDDETRFKSNQKLLLHEISHALGLSHPNDGFTWSHYEDKSARYYKYYLWDYTYTMMSYVGVHTDVATLDLSAIRQNMLPYFHENIAALYNNIDATLKNESQSLQEQYSEKMMIAQEALEISISSFTGGALDMYATSLAKASEAYKTLREIEVELQPDTALFGLNFVTGIFGIIVLAIVILFKRTRQNI